MKSILLSLFFILSSLFSFSQTLIIGDAVQGGYKIPFTKDTINSATMYGYAPDTCLIDLDNDSVIDVEFIADAYMGGMGSFKQVSINTYSNFKVHIDTTYYDSVQTYVYPNVVDTVQRFDIVKKYITGDTITSNIPTDTWNKFIYRYSTGNYPQMVYQNIVLFLNDTSYVGFTKTTDSTQHLYYIKIYLPSPYELHLLEAYSTENIVISPQPPLPDELNIYPNPTTDIINFPAGYSQLKLYNVQGKQLHSFPISETQTSLNVSDLHPGYYLIRLQNEQDDVFGKFLKF